MKFETYLRNERISEWRHSYANYGQLKAKIKDVEVAIREKRRRGEDIAGPLDNWISAMLEQGGISIIPAVESHLEDNLDEPRPDETESLLAPPGASRPSLNRRSRNDPSKALQRKASFRDAIRTLTSVLEPAPQRIDYGAMPLSVILMVRGIHAEVEFFHYLDRQLSKVNTFYQGQESIAFERFRALAGQLTSLARLLESSEKLRKRLESGKGGTFFGSLDTFQMDISAFVGSVSQIAAPVAGRLPVAGHHHSAPGSPTLPHGDAFGEVDSFPATARRKIEEAVMEHYRYLQLIKNYRVLNRMIFAKVLKKFSEAAYFDAQPLYMPKVDEADFSSSKRLDDMIEATERLFLRLHGGNRKCLDKLRLPDTRDEDNTWTAFRTGLFWGLSLVPLVSTVRTLIIGGLAASENNRYFLLVYGGFFVPIFLLLLFCGNVLVWKRYGINHVFIFELDPRDYLNPFQIMELIGFIALILSLCLYFTFNNWLAGLVPSEAYPLLYILFIVLLMLNPLPVFFLSSRRWAVRSLLRATVLSGILPVQFRDVFIADELVSCSYMFTGLATFICAYRHSWSDLELHCNLEHDWLIPMLLNIPNVFRLVQCIRRYVDDPKHRDHLINAGKYFTSSCVIVASFGSKLDKGWASWAVWIGFAVASTAYSLTWDIRKDWALGKPEHGYLRGELTYPQSFYYFAMATNAVLRCSFILVLSPSYWTSLGVDGALVAFGLALLEVCRRGQWNLIRVETEHANNTDNFRVVRDVPLPFKDKDILTGGDADDDEEESDEEGEAAENGAAASETGNQER